MPSVLLDTSFIIRLLDDEDPLHKNAIGYFKYYLEKEYSLYISTISIAEYCVRGSVDDLPLKDLRIIPFNIDHAKRCGVFANCLFGSRSKGKIEVKQRNIIPNDSKLFAQADIHPDIESFITSDSSSEILIKTIRQECQASFNHIDINSPYHQTYGILDL